MNTERDKFLTEAMGKCWHEWYQKPNFIDGHHCKHCGLYWPRKPCKKTQIIIQGCNLSTWEGFGKLWEWALQQEWWDDFIEQHGSQSDPDCDGVFASYGHEHISTELINPEHFADAIYEYLKGLDNEIN